MNKNNFLIIKKMSGKTIEYDPRKDSIKLLTQSKGNNYSTIDFNYPSLNRKDLIDISKINENSKLFKKLTTNRDWSLNLYNLDIEGACPRKFAYYINKEDFTNKNNDIEKSTPKEYFKNINKISFNLTNDDIELSKPQCNKNLSSRHTNPLSPQYKLSHPTLLPPDIPKFIRDSISIKDIKGSSPNKLGFNKNLFKEIIKKEPINDSFPRKSYLRKTKYEYMDYRDVTKNENKYRNTNPLKPQYNWSYIDDKKILGPIDGNAPLVYGKYLYKNPFNLNNKDIEGSNTGSKYPIYKYKGNTYYLKTKDIYGAQGDTLIRGIITNRNINPITPKYQYLGSSEIPNCENNPYFIKSEEKKKDEIKTERKTGDKILRKIKIISEDNNNSNTINEFTAYDRKLFINKFQGHLSKNISENNLILQNKYLESKNLNKIDKLKIQLRPINKRKLKTVKSSSTVTQEKNGLNNYNFFHNKTDDKNTTIENNLTGFIN